MRSTAAAPFVFGAGTGLWPDVFHRSGPFVSGADASLPPDVLEAAAVPARRRRLRLRPDVLELSGAIHGEHRLHMEQVHDPLRVDWLGQTCDCASSDRLFHQLR